MPTAEETATSPLLDGRYQLGECVGQGGAAKVYRAADLLLGRTVAVKMMQGDVGALASPSRVSTEVSVLASLTHPSLVELFDASILPGRPSYLVMEYVEGPTLAQRLHDGPLSEAEAATLGRDLASALHTVHAAGIVHRDVKPANVLLAPAVLPSTGFRAKLADFGVALLVDRTRVTAAGTVVGTAAYLPPEQIRGEGATPAGDIYSLGLLLIEALTGERGFPKATGPGAVMARLFQSPEVPTQFGIGWEDLLIQMTAADPAERPTAADVAHTVARLSAVPTDDPLTPENRPGAAAIATEPLGEPASAALPLPLTEGPDGDHPTRTTMAFSVPANAMLATEPPRPDHDRRNRVAAGVAAAVALLCIVLAVWTAGAAASADSDPRQSTELFTRVAPAAPVEQAPDTTEVVEAPADPTTPVDPKADEAAQKAAEQAQRDAEKQAEAEQKAEEKAERGAENKGEDKGKGK